MTDIVDKQTRSRMMSGIRGKNTTPELVLRRALHARGFRFRVHVTDLPGKPDILLPKFRAVINIHGCFWHGHDCRYFKCPKTNADFWLRKIEGNRNRDRKVNDRLAELGWRTLVVWECATRDIAPDLLARMVAYWLASPFECGELGTTAHEPVADRIAGGVAKSRS